MAKADSRARVDFRLTAEQKALFERAAAIEGRTLSEFLVRSADARAREVVRDHDVWVLSAAGAEQLVSLLLNPPEPNERLRALFRDYNANVDSDGE